MAIIAYKSMTQESRGLQHNEHLLIIIGGIGFSAAMLVFIRWQSTVGQSLCMTVLGAGAYILDTAVNICLVSVSSSLGGKWIPFAHGFYGIGALLSPLIVRFFRLDAYNLYPFLYLSCVALAFYYPNPQH